MLIRRIAIGLGLVLMLAGLALGYRALTTSRTAVTVEWTTASELNTAGFNLYRGESRDGPFTLVNPDLIPHAADPLVGGSYSYADAAVQAGRVYYYQLEDVEMTGKSTRHGPIEVKAERNFGADALIAAALFGAGLLGLVIAWPPKRPVALPAQ
jgi:hypothetical protein